LKRNHSNIPYWKVPNTSKQSISGGSGAGFWRFDTSKNLIEASLEGIVVSESRDHSYFEAIDSDYIYNDFLSKLRKPFLCSKS